MSTTSTHQDIPEETLDALVELVETGPVPLGGYTLAEIDAVGAVEHLMEGQAAPELVAEAVRSLAARNLISTDADSDEVKIRGDLGIATAFQHRSRLTIDARVSGTEPDQPWRFILMPQPEGVTLEVLIDALGIHFYSLRRAEDTLDRLWERLPSGDRGPEDADAQALLEASPRTALVSINRWDEEGNRETHDVVLVQEEDTCHALVRDADEPSRLVATGMDDGEWRDLITRQAKVGH